MNTLDSEEEYVENDEYDSEGSDWTHPDESREILSQRITEQTRRSGIHTTGLKATRPLRRTVSLITLLQLNLIKT